MRLPGLDIFRGVAILLMVIFHFSFDLNNFHIVDLDLKHGDFWKYFRYFIVSMFVFSAGISLQLANKNGIDLAKLKKRILVLSLASLAVTVGSYTQFPKTWIYFGILHFFLFSSLVGLLFLKLPKLTLMSAVFILLGYNFSFLNMHWLYAVLQEPLSLPSYYTEDLANIIPWFGVFLLGISFTQYGFAQRAFKLSLFEKNNSFNIIFSYIGKHSLIIYLLHQPLLFAIFLSLKHFF